MTKEEWTQAKEKVTKYQSLEYELDKVDSALKNIRAYESFTLCTRSSAGNANIWITPEIRTELIALIQNYRERIATAMEEV